MTPSATPSPGASKGALAAAVCYFLWGLVPLYWRELASVDEFELIAHRHVWSLALLLLILALQRAFGGIVDVLRAPSAIGINLLGAALLSANWLVYVWGVNHGHVIETSLGYFLVPLVNVATGRFLLHEHLRRTQVLAIALATFGVALLVLQLGRVPWIALTLAGSWGAYSLMRKKSPLPAVTGLAIETLLLAPFAIGFLIWRHLEGAGVLGRAEPRIQILVLCAGVITAIPLLLFAYGAKRIRLSTLGLLQYLAPTVQLMLGVWVFHEVFSGARLISFSFIWAALALYTTDNLLAQRRYRL